MKYLFIGYDEKGEAVGSFVLFAASAGIEIVKLNALSILHDAGIKCKTCSVEIAPTQKLT